MLTESTALGIKKYLAKEDPNNLRKAKAGQRRLWIFSIVARLLFYVFVFKVVIPYLRSKGLGKALWVAAIPAFIAWKKL